MSTVYTGLCRDGPLARKVLTRVDQTRVTLPDDDTGFYVYTPAVRGGAQPQGWRWIKQERSNGNS